MIEEANLIEDKNQENQNNKDILAERKKLRSILPYQTEEIFK